MSSPVAVTQALRKNAVAVVSSKAADRLHLLQGQERKLPQLVV